ncbi:UNVERIFIED_CONTAM: Transcription repressor [Sesamum calycinum]|uniref:Transcription repressor n=1 Tax=Sesamum calycinum TaxID=2727403 RepID=A0AAW2QYU5_9LAMI
MGRSPCCSKVGLRRGPWSTKEDNLLTNYIQQHGEGQWRSLPKKAVLVPRLMVICGNRAAEMWEELQTEVDELSPAGIKRGNISEDEEDLIVRLHGLLGNRWSLIAGRLPGRTDNEIKNYWNTHLLKKLKSAGINPKPHKDLPKPPKVKKSDGGAAGKKQRKQKKAVVAADNERISKLGGGGGGEEPPASKSSEEQVNNPPKTKVYLPKPIRVSSVFSRTSSYDSLASGTSSSDGGEAAEKVAEVVSYVPVEWPPLFELEDANYAVCGGGGGGGEEDDFLGGGYILPVLHHSDSISSDVNMLEKVYDEYLQLL